MNYPQIIQGGMGAGVSSWRLANAVASGGQLGVVAGTALDVILARRLQVGDPGGHMRRALAQFPVPGVAERILDRYFIEGGKADDAPFKSNPVPALKPRGMLLELMVAANFVEVWLAKEGHDGVVGVNLLEKIQVPNVPSIYGAMLADTDFILMGAGIPRAIPGVLDCFARGEGAELAIDVQGEGAKAKVQFDPRELWGAGGVQSPPKLRRPQFLAIVASVTLATMLKRKANGKVNGFIVEGPTAGGHNAPPRGPLKLDENNEPIYGPRDTADPAGFVKLGLPFWLAGSHGHADGLRRAQDAGATGIQVGTVFAYCEESGIDPAIKKRVMQQVIDGTVHIVTDAVASPTGFPFKIVDLQGTMKDPAVYSARKRICDLGYLRHAFEKEDGSIAWRCPSEPVDHYLRKGGNLADTEQRMCVCNGLMATIGLGQSRRDGSHEAALVTSGDALVVLGRMLPEGTTTYHARDVLDLLLGRPGLLSEQADATPAPGTARP